MTYNTFNNESSPYLSIEILKKSRKYYKIIQKLYDWDGRVVFLRFIVSVIFEEVAMCQLVFNWDYYGVKNTTKINKWQDMQLSPLYTNICYFENSERDWRVLDATDKCGTVCHDMPKSLLVIVSTEIKKVKILNHTKKTWAQRDSKGITIGIMQGG